MARMTTAALLLAVATVGQVTFSTPREAVGWAIAHQAELPETQRPLYRYVWIPEWMATPPGTPLQPYDERHIAAILSYALNEVASQTGTIVPPQRIANGWMLAVYLPNYASAKKPSAANKEKTQLQVLTEVWDSLAVDDPYFHETKENSGVGSGGERAAKYTAAAHLDPAHAGLLQTIQGGPALCYRADWLLEKLTGIEHYYRFAQFGKTQQEVYASIGVSEELAKALDGDQRVAIFVSGVTGKPRRVDRIQGALGRSGTGAVWQTWDLADESVKANQHPLYNLIEFNPDGGETIFEKANGLHGYLLFNAQRQLVAEAPPEIAKDHTIPGPPDGPGSARLGGAISCIRCHGAADGLQPVANDVARLLQSGVDVLDDYAGKDQSDIVLRLAGLYSGDFDRRLSLGRDDYDLAVRRATTTEGLAAGFGASEASKLMSQLYASYAYKRVDAAQACRELGHVPIADDPRITLKEVLPPAFPENVVIASLKAGIPVRRRDWEQVYSIAMLRVQQGVKK